MAQIVGSRIGLIQYTAGTDPRPGRTAHNAERQLIEDTVVIGGQGTEPARPTAGKGRALYWNNDRNVLQWDTGTGWLDVNTVGGGGTPGTTIVAGTGTEGTSMRGARADHRHSIPLATGTTGGAMSAADKAKLDAAIATGTANTLMLRDAAGRSQAASPAASADVATKGYVDSVVGGAAAPVVTNENNGLATPAMLHASNLVALADPLATANMLVLRDANGRSQFANPSLGPDAANKSYVDGQISGHRHDGAHITTGTIAGARLALATTTSHGGMSAEDKAKLNGASVAALTGSLVMRSGTGTFEAATPSLATDVANKSYVDNGLAGKAGTSHTHDASAIASGTIPTARLPLATASTDGMMPAVHYAQLNGAVSAATASALVMRDINGRAQFADPAVSGDAATKYYVDNGLAGKSSTAHSHAFADILSKPSTYPPSAHSHAWTDITSKPTTFPPSGHGHGAGDISTSIAENASTIPLRTSGGQVRTASPSHTSDATPKGYVDGHTWDASDIVSGYFASGRVNKSSYAYNTAWNGVGTIKTVHVRDTSYELCFYTSTIRHKENITPWEPDPRNLLAVEPAEFNRKDPATGKVNMDRREVGVIAEQAGQTVPEFVVLEPNEFDEDGNHVVSGWSYMQWTTAHQVLHRWTAKRDDHQDARLARIEEALGLPPLPEGN